MELSCTASSMDCTGLIPTLPENEDAAEAYKEIYDYGPPDPDDYAPANDSKKR